MKFGKLKEGSLVKFIAVETSAGVYLPTGTEMPRLLGRYSKGDESAIYEATADDAGVIVAGPEMAGGGNLPLWQVLVKGDIWWFIEDSLLLIDS